MNISNVTELFMLRMILLTKTHTIFFIFLPLFLILFVLLFFFFFLFYCDPSWILIDVFDASKYIPLCQTNFHSLFCARIVSISSGEQSCINWRSCAFLPITMDIFKDAIVITVIITFDEFKFFRYSFIYWWNDFKTFETSPVP